MAVLTTLADAIVSELNDSSRSWYGQFIAVRMNVPIVNREATKNLSVIVTPKAKETTKITRSKSNDLCEYYIGIQQALLNGNNEETDPLILLGETIQDYFDQGDRLETYAAACEQTAFGTDTETPWLAVQDHEGLLLYTGVIRLAFRVHR